MRPSSAVELVGCRFSSTWRQENKSRSIRLKKVETCDFPESVSSQVQTCLETKNKTWPKKKILVETIDRIFSFFEWHQLSKTDGIRCSLPPSSWSRHHFDSSSRKDCLIALNVAENVLWMGDTSLDRSSWALTIKTFILSFLPRFEPETTEIEGENRSTVIRHEQNWRLANSFSVELLRSMPVVQLRKCSFGNDVNKYTQTRNL